MRTKIQNSCRLTFCKVTHTRTHTRTHAQTHARARTRTHTHTRNFSDIILQTEKNEKNPSWYRISIERVGLTKKCYWWSVFVLIFELLYSVRRNRQSQKYLYHGLRLREI
jgi:hypothetical protein